MITHICHQFTIIATIHCAQLVRHNLMSTHSHKQTSLNPVPPTWGRPAAAAARVHRAMRNAVHPTCLGQAATYAVKDQFWVYFMDPDHDVSVLDPQLGLGD